MSENIEQIEYYFPPNWILDGTDGLDEEASVEHYAKLLQARLEKVFPDTSITVRHTWKWDCAKTLINGQVPRDMPGQKLAYELVGYIEDVANELYQDFDAWTVAEKSLMDDKRKQLEDNIERAVQDGRIIAQSAPTVHHRVFIDVWNCRARVARYVNDDPNARWTATTTVEYAENFEDLEDAAAEAVNEQGGWITQSGHYACPPELASRAVWPTE